MADLEAVRKIRDEMLACHAEMSSYRDETEVVWDEASGYRDETFLARREISAHRDETMAHLKEVKVYRDETMAHRDETMVYCNATLANIAAREEVAAHNTAAEVCPFDPCVRLTIMSIVDPSSSDYTRSYVVEAEAR